MRTLLITAMLAFFLPLSALEFAVPLSYISGEDVSTYAAKPGVPLPEEAPAVVANYLVYTAEYQNKRIWASGIVLVPQTAGPKDLVSLQRGTVLADREIPTEALLGVLRGTAEVEFNLADAFILAAHGNIVVMADYFGGGLSKDMLHPYLIREANTICTRRALEAGAKVIKRRRIQTTGDLFLAGYSEGGHVTMSLLKSLESDPLSGYQLTGAAIGAAPHDVTTTGVASLAYDAPGSTIYFGLAFHSFNTYALGREPSSTFQSPWDEQVDEVYGGKYTAEELVSVIPMLPSMYFTPEMIGGVVMQTDPEFLGTLMANSTLADRPESPVLLYHSGDDSTVPSFNTLLMFNALTNGGTENMDRTFLAPFDLSTGQLENLGGHTEAVNYATWMSNMLGFKDKVQTPAANG